MSRKSAERLYRSFRESAPKRFGRVRVRVPKHVAVIGHVNAIEYDTTHGGSTKKYRHTFAPGSRPVLVVSAARGGLFLIGTRYKFTDRGIVDIDSRGREIE